MNRVLIVDDKDDNLYLLRVLLEGHGYEVVAARHGAEALALARQDPPDLIVADILMPIMDGFALCREWMQDQSLHAVPFIFYTATYTDDRDREFALSLGAARFVVKPEEPEVLMDIVRETLQQVRSASTPEPSPVAPPEVPETVYLQQYNETLIRKLEAKMGELEQANRMLKQDITERLRTEEELRTSRALYCSLVENLPQSIFRKDREGRFQFVNERFCRDLQRPLEDIVGKTDADFFPPDLAQAYRSDDLRVMASEKVLDQEERHLGADGRETFVHVIKTPLRDARGRNCGVQGVFWDITERRQAEERLRQHAALLDAANDAIYVRTLEHTVTYWNDGAERIYGWTRDEVLGRKVHEMLVYEIGVFETAQAALLAQGGWAGELTITGRTGKKVTIFGRWTLLLDEASQPKAVLVINTDITEKKQLETNYFRAQRLESVGALAAGIAHDLNNILAPILMTGQMLHETVVDPKDRELLAIIETCAQRGADVVKQLLTFARGKPGARAALPVRHLLCEAFKLVRETFPKNIRLCNQVLKELWSVTGDATQIDQAIMNLCVNARDAMLEGGILTLAAENLTLDEAFAATLPQAKPGAYVCASVTDTGTGIASDDLDHIFDPFFTTKEPGKGTGLGLATVLGIVHGHGGFVRVNSVVGTGTTFELYFPATPETQATAPGPPGTAPPRGQDELILVVEDEACVCGVIRQTLVHHGYRVATASEGAQALELFAQHRGQIRAVLTDMMMPGLDGVALVRAIQAQEPRLPCLGMTGVGEKATIKGLEEVSLRAMLTKPFTRTVLLDALHHALAVPGTA